MLNLFRNLEKYVLLNYFTISNGEIKHQNKSFFKYFHLYKFFT